MTHFRPVFRDPRTGGLHPERFPAADARHARAGRYCALLLIARQFGSAGMGVATLISLIAIGAIGARSQAMITLALVLTALLFCVAIGLPMGIWLARSPRAAKIIRPLLDAMQTTPRLSTRCRS